MRDKIFYVVCFGFLFGVLWRSFVVLDLYFVVLFTVISVALFLFFTLISKNKWGILFSIFIFVFSLGIFRFSMVDVVNPVVFESQVGQKVNLYGEIIDEPNIKENSQQLVVEIKIEENTTKILLSVNLGEYYRYGDEVNFIGILKKPENFITDTGKEFDYVNYLRKDGILYVMSYPKIEVLSRGNGNMVRSALFSTKEKFLEKVNFAISAPENLLMGGLILGEKASFDESMRQSFVDTGTIHIVALSGYNITIVAEWVMKLFNFLPQNLGIGAGIFAILLFVLMTGGGSTAVRAGIMATLALVARATGRNYDVARALALAGVFMVLLNPFLLVFDVSFQLSFIATMAVIFLAPKIEKYFMWAPVRFGLRDIFSVTTAAYLFVLPFILYKMGNFSLVALPANILILPFIPFTMMLGFLTGLAGIIWYVLAVPFGFFSYLFLHYELGVISFFSKLPFAAFSFPNFPFFLTIAVYAYFIYRLFGRSIKEFFIEPPESSSQ
ncbi:MAG: ComEC/Rec2 family competence protein [Minisyncoccia bacterium]